MAAREKMQYRQGKFMGSCPLLVITSTIRIREELDRL
jgi:hypothetical protein